MSDHKSYLTVFISFIILISNLSFATDLRPAAVQEKIDEVFNELTKDGMRDGWHYNGSGFYGVMGLEDAKIIRHLIASQPDKKEMIFMDVGAASGGWGRATFALLTTEFADSDKNFVIISITGAYEMESGIDTLGNVTHYRFNCFKIENIGVELLARCLDVKGKVDLIFSLWTLRHLVDPLGTLIQLYDHLDLAGYLIFNGSFIDFKDNDLTEPIQMMSLFLDAGLTILSDPYTVSGRSGGYFVLKRTSDMPLEIDVIYSGNLYDVRCFDQCYSGCRAEYKRTKQPESREFVDGLDPYLIFLESKYQRISWYGHRSILDELLSFVPDEALYRENAENTLEKRREVIQKLESKIEEITKNIENLNEIIRKIDDKESTLKDSLIGMVNYHHESIENLMSKILQCKQGHSICEYI